MSQLPSPRKLNLTCLIILNQNGTIATIDATQPDLFFALKGGLNRFGIVTSAVYRTHVQPPEVYVRLHDPLPSFQSLAQYPIEA